MPGRRTNLALLAMLALALITGGLAFAAGTGWGRPAVIAHAVTGFALVLLSPWKLPIARRGLRRRRGGRAASLALTLLVMVTVVTGVLQATGGALTLGPVTTMQVHVGAALLAMPLALFHLVRRPVRPRRPDLDRRALLGAGLLGVGGLAMMGAVEVLTRLAGLPGATRRWTGSYERGSGRPDQMPVTQWLDDRVPAPGEDWALRVQGGGPERTVTLDELRAGAEPVDALLDCTGGWYARQTWGAVRLSQLLEQRSGRSVEVRSLTGYARRFPLGAAGDLWVATSVGGADLSAGHGHPARLVAPGRRGFWWVKWLDRITVDDRPWWWQSPFPLT